MADITQLILTKYYGFGADPRNEKFLASHNGTYDPSCYQRRSSSSGHSGAQTAQVALDQATSSEIVKDETEVLNTGDSPGSANVRSSRAIQEDDTLEDQLSDSNEYEAVLESPEVPTNGPSSEKKRNPEGTIKEPNCKSEKNEERDEGSRIESTLGQLEDILDNVSDISSIPMRKKLKKRSPLTAPSTMAWQSPPVAKKLPACNGIFLDLSTLSLDEFPSNTLSNIPNLRMVYLDNNNLTALPEELFSSLKLLQWLDVRNNELSTLPKSIKHHNCLETILLEGNEFEELPLELCTLPKLKDLQTSRNPLKFPSQDVLALGFAATINCLRSEWNKLNPEEAVEYPEKDRKPKPSTILCADPPTWRLLSKSSCLPGSSSTSQIPGAARKISVRQRSRTYKPSNRYESADSKLNFPRESCAKSASSKEETAEMDLRSITKPKLPKIDPKRCSFQSSRVQGKERVFDIITNDRTMEQLRPMRLRDPDRMLAFLENYLGIEKRSMGWFPPRCVNNGEDEKLGLKLLWISKVKEMLSEQAAALQKIKDKEALAEWRRDTRSWEKSMNRARNRKEEDIPFGIDIEELRGLFKKSSKSKLRGTSISGGLTTPRNIDKKMTDLYKSLNQLHEARKSDTLSPQAEQKLLQNEIKKLSEIQAEIQKLRRCNEKAFETFEAVELLPQIQPYKPPPSIII